MTEEENQENEEKIKVEVKTEGDAREESKSRSPWLYSTIILAIIVVALLGMQMTGMLTAGDGETITVQDQISPQAAANKALAFININLVQPGTQVALESVEEMSGVYNVSTIYAGNNIPVYVTKDGTYIIVPGLGAMNMDTYAAPQAPEPQPPEIDIPKTDRPVLDLFIFSFCPAGTAAEKSLVPVGNLLSGYADINVKFFSHMHGQYEKEENIRQECIQREEPEKFWAYLAEFLYSSDVSACGRDAACVKAAADVIMESVGIDVSGVNACIETDGESIYAAEQAEAGSMGLRYSPSFVINGVYLSSLDRSPDGIKTALCSAFNTQPDECLETLSASGETTSGGCS